MIGDANIAKGVDKYKKKAKLSPKRNNLAFGL